MNPILAVYLVGVVVMVIVATQGVGMAPRNEYTMDLSDREDARLRTWAVLLAAIFWPVIVIVFLALISRRK